MVGGAEFAQALQEGPWRGFGIIGRDEDGQALTGFSNMLAVAFGAAAGGVLRYWVAMWFGMHAGEGFPWGTLFINVTGSAFIGFFATLSGPDGRLLVAPQARLMVMTGVCGGYTTFSTFSLETLRLLEDRQWGAAAMNATASVLLCLIGVWLGHTLAGALNQR